MSYEPPSPPANLPTEVVDTLNEAPPELLREVTRYTEALAEYKEREARLEEETDNTNVEERPDDLPDDVPTKATITIKEINDNRYYYWQWREGDRIKSKYKGAGQSRQVRSFTPVSIAPGDKYNNTVISSDLHHCQ